MTFDEEKEAAKFFNEMRDIQAIFMKYILAEDNPDDLSLLSNHVFFDKNMSTEDKYFKLKEITYLIQNISNNHYRTPLFNSKIEKIILFFKEDIKQTFSNDELFKVFHSNRRVLYFLFKEKMLVINDNILDKLQNKKMILRYHSQFFYSEILAYLKGSDLDLSSEDQIKYEEYIKKKEIGINDSYICQIIRNDSIDKFLEYINQCNFPINSSISKSIYETNNFLYDNGENLDITDNEPKYIEYAAFYGAVKIFTYLKMSGAQINPSIWLYAIHGKNSKIIHMLVDDNINPRDTTYKECLIEAIKCHHNDIARFILYNLADKNVDVSQSIIQYYNFELFEDEFKKNFFEFIKYDHVSIVKILLKNATKEILNSKIILKHLI